MGEVDWAHVFTYVTVLILACFGGVVDFVDELRKSTERLSMKVILFNLFARLLMSAFAGLIMFWILQEQSEDGVVILSGYSAMSIAITGFLGDQAVKVFIKIWERIAK
mgnify:FL=1